MLVNITRLVRIDDVRMHDLAVEGDKHIEVLDFDADTWNRCRVMELGVDGRVLVQRAEGGGREFIDLTSKRSRWVL